ncbi:MAG: hypothetical protein ACKOBV_10995, partial [Candidatus Kapaibacterium sp.]
MLGHEDVRELRALLHGLDVDGPEDPRARLEVCALVHTELLERYVADSDTFFSSAVAKHKSVCTALRMDEETSRSLSSLLNVATDPKRAQSIISPTLPANYTVLLTWMLDVCEHGLREKDGDAHGQGSREMPGLPVEAGSVVDALGIHAPDVRHPHGADSAPRLHRLVVMETGERMMTAAGEIHVLPCMNEEGRDVRLALRESLLDVAAHVWIGATLHVTEARALDAERLVTTGDSVCVIEPDVLVDVTDVAECFHTKGTEPLLSLLRKWTQDATGEAVVTGSIINSCFDDIIEDPDKDFDDMFRDACAARPLATISVLSAERRLAVKETVREHVQRLREVMKRLSYARAVVEPGFISPEYGLQGRLDLLLEHEDHPLHKTIIELKSGSAPALGSGTAYPTPKSRVWRNHEAQIACYHLLLQSAYPGRYGDSEILYSRTGEQPLRNVEVKASLLRQVIGCRNAIVRMEHDLRSKDFSVMKKLCAPIPHLPPFLAGA